MSKGKYQSKKHGFNARPLALLLAVTLLMGCAIGGTIAWLTASTQDVTNTFTVGDVTITLEETLLTFSDDGTVTEGTKTADVDNQYPMIPGNTYKKDPTVTVSSDSEDCWLFVKFEKGSKTDEYITYTPNWTGWKQGEGGEGKVPLDVWYREVKKTDTTKTWDLLTGNTITIKADKVTKDTMSDAVTNSSLKYTAYAIQSANIGTDKTTEAEKAAAAWAQLQSTQNSGSQSQG